MLALCRGSIPRQRRTWLWPKTPCNLWEPWMHNCGPHPFDAKWRPCPLPRARRGCFCGDDKIPLQHWRPVLRPCLKNATPLPISLAAARLARPTQVRDAMYCAASTGFAAMAHPARGRILPVNARAGWLSALCAKRFSQLRPPQLTARNRSKGSWTACSAQPLPKLRAWGGS